MLSKRGIRNPGAVCYLIAPLQQLLNSPQFSTLATGTEGPDLPFDAVVRILTSWLTSDTQPETKCFLGLRLWMAFYHNKDGDMHTQRDAAEFYSDLISRLTQEFSRMASEVAQEWNELYVGQLVNTLKAMDSTNPLHRLEKAERFFYISVTVNPSDGQNSLESSLRDFTRTETVPFRWPDLETKQLGAPVPTGKTTTFRKLPQHLAFHLKRFRFDRDTMRKEKLHHRFAFPAVLDMAPYMDPSQAGTTCTDSTALPGQLYRLSGVVVHRGHSAYSGHYNSFIRDRLSSATSSSDNTATVGVSGSPAGLEEALRGEVWHCFDDDRVTRCDVARLVREALGEDWDSSDSSDNSDDGADEGGMGGVEGQDVVVRDTAGDGGSEESVSTAEEQGGINAVATSGDTTLEDDAGQGPDGAVYREEGSAGVDGEQSGGDDRSCDDNGEDRGDSSDSDSCCDSDEEGSDDEDEDGENAPRSAFMLFYERM